MKKTTLIIAALAFTGLFFVQATTGEKDSTKEVVIKSLSEEAISAHKAQFTNFLEVTSMEFVQVEEEQYLKVVGTDADAEVMSELFMVSECGACQTTVWNPPICKPCTVPGIEVGVNCWECDEDSAPGPGF